jgi:hypothetical protein
MRLLTIAGLFLSALCVSAQTTDASTSLNQLLAEVAKLPLCAVCVPIALRRYSRVELTALTASMCGQVTPDFAVRTWRSHLFVR